MEIIVQGIAKKTYMPNWIEISLDFSRKENSYEDAIKLGMEDVDKFVENVLSKINLSKENIKTKVFRVYEDAKFDYETKQEIKLGFIYNQQAEISIEYSIDKITKMIQALTELKNPPKYKINFKLKDEEEKKTEVIAEAFENAKKRAETIAKTDKKELKKCLKTDFKPFEQNILYGNTIESLDMMNSRARVMMCKEEENNFKEMFERIFTPEEIEIQETVYCMWNAE